MRQVGGPLALGLALACVEWAGPRLAGPKLAIVPVLAGAMGTSGGTLLDDLDRIRVVVRQLPGRSLVADTSVGVDADGSAQVTVPVLVIGVSPTLFEVLLEGIRSSDGKLLYTGIDTVAVTGAIPIPPLSVPVTYVGPCALGAGCRVTLGPQDITLKQGESLTPTVTVDSLGFPVANVPVQLVNVTPGLVALASGLALTPLSGTSCGPARIAASVPGSADTLRLRIDAPVTQAPLLFAGDSAGGLSSGVFCTNTDGSGRFKVSPGGAFGDVNPRWSPDRRRVVYTFDAGGGQALWVAGWAGDTVALVVGDILTGAYRPRWSPNGQHLGYECGDGLANNVCMIGDATGPISLLSQVLRTVLSDLVLTRPTGPGSFAWDPRIPDRLAFVRDSVPLLGNTSSAIYTVNFDGSGLQQLTPKPLDAGQGVLQIAELDWSPRGDVIVFSATDPQVVRKLYVINRDGSGFRQLTKGADDDSHPVVSPGGTQILFLRSLAQSCSLDYWRIGVDGTGEQQVSAERFCNISTARLGHDWSPDGTQIVLVGGGALGGFAIYRLPAGVTAATYDRDRILAGRDTDPGGFVADIQPSWRP